LIGTDQCPCHCLNTYNFEKCQSHCSMAFIRKIILMINDRDLFRQIGEKILTPQPITKR
jgi:hypothetical protein